MLAEIHHGVHLHLPGGGSEEVLKQVSPGFAQLSGGNAAWITKSMTRFQCKPTLNNPGGGRSGEGFIAITANGVKYTLDHMIVRNTLPVQKAWLQFMAPGGLEPQPPVNRVRIWLMVTRIEDRFGNRVNYTWSGDRLVAIQSDGVGAGDDNRSLTINYIGDQVSSIVANGSPSRSVFYTYTTAPGAVAALSTVTLPDTSMWTYQHTSGGLLTVPGGLEPVQTPNTCSEPATSKGEFTYTITHPSKLIGTFSFLARRNYRSVPVFLCNSEGNGDYQVLVFPNYSDNFALLSKTFSGPALEQASTWSYDYGSVPIIVPCEGCADFKTVTVTEPDGARLESDFGVEFDGNEGRLLRWRTRSPSNALLASRAHAYPSEPPPSAPYPDRYGESFVDSGDRTSVRVRPLLSTVATQQGVNFTRSVNTFDAFARPLSETHASDGSPAFSRTQTLSYHDDYDIWVLAQEASRSTDGIAVHSTVFDPSTARPISVTEFGRLDRTLTWHSDGNLHQLSDAQGRAFTLTNTERGVAKSVQLPTGPTLSATVDNFGNLLSVTDAVGFTTHYQYDSRDRLSRIDYPSADTVNWAPTLISTAPTILSEYGIPAGLWQRTETTGALVKNTWFDARWRPILSRESVTDGSTTATFLRRRFDHRNREIFSSYPVASLAVFTSLSTGVLKTFDALDRFTSSAIDSELGTLTTNNAYPSGSLRTISTDARGFVTHTDYQAYDAPSMAWPRRIVAAVGQPEQQTTEITRDVFAKPLRMTRSGVYAGNPVSLDRDFVYDANQRLCKTVEPESGATVVDYDSVNQVAWSAIGRNLPSPASCNRDLVSVPENVRSTHSYDAMARLLSINHPEGTKDVRFSYFADGALETARTLDIPGPPTSTWTYTYNKRRLLEAELLSFDSRTFGLDWEYNTRGQLAALVYPGGASVDWNPDARGRPRQAAGASTYATVNSRHANGSVANMAYGNGQSLSTTLNSRLLPAMRSVGSLMSYTLSYDPNANLQTITDNIGTETRTMVYDGQGRMTQANAPAIFGNETYRYDPLDNVRSASFGTATFTHQYDATHNRLDAINLNGTPYLDYSHNDQGDTTLRQFVPSDSLFANGFETSPANASDPGRRWAAGVAPSQSLQYDRAHRLTGVVGIESYIYDAHGRRVATVRSSDGLQRYQVYSQSGQMLYTEDQRSNQIIDYLYVDGGLVAERSRPLSGAPITLRYQHTDMRGSPVVQSDAAGTQIRRTIYEPYGTTDDGIYVDGPGYTGHATDASTGLSYMQQRYYDPIGFRFLSVDPVAAGAESFSRYWYANNNPYKYTDPDGRESLPSTGQPFLDWLVSSGDSRPTAGQVVVDQLHADVNRPISATRALELTATAMTVGAGGASAPLRVAQAESAAVGGSTTLFRAVTNGELNQVRATGGFEAGTNSLGGKWFAETADDAVKWGDAMNGSGSSTILEVQLPRAQADQLMRVERLDGIGPARYGELDQLQGAKIKELPQ